MPALLTTAEPPMTRESPRGRVLRWLEHAISSGEIPRGGEIPTVRVLAKSLGVALNTAAAAVEEAEERGLVARRRPGAHRRIAAERPSSQLSSSTIYVLGSLRDYADIATTPGGSDAMLAFEVARRISLLGRPVSLLNSDSISGAVLDAVFESRPGAFVVANAVRGEESAMRTLSRCRETGVPAVAYGNAPELCAFDRAYSDHRAGSRDLTRWLVARGRRRIVPFLPFAPTRFWERERLAGYAEAMRETRLEPQHDVVFGSSELGDFNTAETFRLYTSLALSALVALRRDGGELPDALLCLNDDWAMPALAAIRDLGLVPNRDILVAGYDNMTHRPRHDFLGRLTPAVTVDKHNERSAEDLAALVAARMDGSLPPEPQARIHAHEVVVLDDTL